MLTTESEASNNWCPMTRMLPEGAGISSRNCIASACQMWRWDTRDITGLRRKFFPAREQGATTEPTLRTPGVLASWEWVPYDEAEGVRAGWLEPEAEMLQRRIGFCGLAGMPQYAAMEVPWGER